MEKVLIWGQENSFVSFDDEVDGVEDEGVEVPWVRFKRGGRSFYMWSGP